MTEPILVVGGDSLIGGALTRYWEDAGRDVISTTRRPVEPGSGRVRFDLAESLDCLPAPVAAAVICAAVTRLEDCARDPAGTRYLNVTRTTDLVRDLVSRGSFVTLLSSSLVFDGRVPKTPADTPLSPTTEYGRQKAELESALRSCADRIAVLRLTKVFHPGLPVLQSWKQALARGEDIHPYPDYLCSPVPLRLVIDAIVELTQRRLCGTWQLSAPDQISYVEIAELLLRRRPSPAARIVPAPFPAGASQPLARHATLDATPLATTLGLNIPASRQTVQEVLNDL